MVIVVAVCNAVAFLGGVVMRFFTLRAKEYKLVAFSFEFISRIVLILLGSITMIFVGYKVKGGWGATTAFLIIVCFFLYVNGMLSFIQLW